MKYVVHVVTRVACLRTTGTNCDQTRWLASHNMEDVPDDGKRTQHLSIGHFCITDLPEKQEFEVGHCPTEDMQADFLTKPLQGATFEKMSKWLMGIE